MASEKGVDPKKMKARLLAERAALVRLALASEEGRRPVELDPARVGRLSRMDALQEQEMARAIERRRTLGVRRIDAALRRIEEDEYGDCVACGEAIAPKRLELDPTAPRCIDCARGADAER